MAVDNGQTLQGQLYDREKDLVIPFTETMKNEGNADLDVGSARTEVIPNDAASSKVRVYSQPGSLSSIYLAVPGVVNVNLPNVLTAIEVTYNTNSAESTSVNEVGIAEWAGTAGGLNLNPTGAATSSASSIPDLIPTIQESSAWGERVPCMSYLFYIAGNHTIADVITRLETILTLTVTGVVAGVVTTSAAHGLSLNQPVKFLTAVGAAGGLTVGTTYYVKTIPSTTTFTYSATAGGAALSGHSATSGTLAPVVSEWPRFKPTAHTFILKGAQLNLHLSVEAALNYKFSASNVSYAISPYSGSDAYSASRETGVTVKSMRIPPTIHGAISLTGGTSTTSSIDADAEAHVPAVTGTGGAPSFSAVDNVKTISGSITAAVTPTSLSATSGVTAIPTAGLYIYDVTDNQYQIGLNQLRVILINFNVFA